MFKSIITAATVSTILAISPYTPAFAGESGGGGGGGFNGMNDDTFITMTNPDGSTVTGRYGRTNNSRVTRYRTKRGRQTRVVKRHKRFRDRNGRKRSRPYAHNHSTGVTSIGVRPGLRVIFGRGTGIEFSF